jgi:gliding motility-associated-like protein
MKFLHIAFILFLTQNIVQAQVAAPRLRCVKRDTLLWELPTVGCGSVTGYRVFAARNFNGPYQILATVPGAAQTRYFHNNTEGGTWYYYMETVANCNGQSVRQSDTLDNQPPQLTSVLTLNVINNSTVEVRWRRNPSPEVVGYKVYKKTATGLIPIANINNKDTVRYLDTNASANKKNEEYQVLAVDDCGNTSLFDVNHQTILMTAAQSRCDQKITLKWNLYKNWANPIIKHEIWASINGRTSTLIASVGGKDTTYIYQNAKDKSRYAFFVRAVQETSNITSKSNDTTVVGDIIEPVRDLTIENITVDQRNRIELIWRWNNDAKVDTVEILRGSLDSSGLKVVARFKPTLPLDDGYLFLDSTVNAGSQPYTYRIRTVDQCKAPVSSNVGKSVQLKGFPRQNRQNELTWSPFELDGATVTGYQVIRIYKNVPTEVGLPISPLSPPQYFDTTTPDETAVCYRIGANYSYKLKDGSLENATAYSNTICINQFAGLWMPNAFTPAGKNPEFKPVFSFEANITAYEMLIFDRWGRILFRTNDTKTGWEGKSMNGVELPQGAYSFIVRVGQISGGLIERKGIVMLLR